MEDPKHFSSNKIIVKDDTFIIVLELPEDDPFFDKKKKLLCDKGFDIKEQIQLQSSFSLDSVATTLRKILHIARIIHLDEVELYFGENDECSSVEYCSLRNEVEALNSIAALLDGMLSSKTHREMNVLQTLRDAVVDRIENSMEDNRVETRIDKSYSCDIEKSIAEWGQRNGVHSRLEIVYVEGAGRGAIATEDLKVGDIALEIPVSIIISEELVRHSDMYHILEKIDGISSETMLLLWSMKERHNCNSKSKIYFDTLPKEFNTGLSFGVDAIMASDGTLLFDEIMQAKEHLRVQYDELVSALCNNYPDVFPPELYTWEQFLWACELWYSNSMKIKFLDGKLRTCLIPIAGFLNHSLHPHIIHYGKVDSITNTLKFPLSRPCRVGEQCCLSYGNFSGAHLITFYGFLPQGDNRYDIIPLDIDAGEADSTEDCPMSSWATHMVRGTWLSKNHNIFCYGLPCPLLDLFRRARVPMPYTKTITQSNLEIEMEILEDLQSTFSNMMENLGDPDLVDRENTSWDVKLALDFKDLQRRIVSSILTSCDAGFKLVQNELSKCMAEE
ncbi:N-lysine methyltransferase setd6 isoform X2 [Ricinus communis]|uniref:N-lysine methyltransferase setd6 isoform X2 n=1 Tax=Ricinus communis TaxID=3988 RepID=UPI00201A8929|nr:N-lysine methyltransferase setd6 isoform X2 [Ricinus communis]